MKLRRGRRYTIDGIEVDILEGTTNPTEILFIQWAIDFKWERIFILR